MVQFNTLLTVYLGLFLLALLGRLLLTGLNVGHLRRVGDKVPAVFNGLIDGDTMTRMRNYTVDSSRFASVEEVTMDAVTLMILLSGFLPWMVDVLDVLSLPFVPSGLLFFGILALISGLASLPFNLYGTFVIERRYGFSTISFKLWLIDLFKGIVITALLMGMLLGAFLTLIQYAPRSWWFWVWLVYASFQMLMVWLYPMVIAPLFNRYEPVGNDSLREAIVAMMARVGLKTEGVFQVDEGRRSRHSNAYFTGLGSTKRIVLYDTLLASHSDDEILAILSHEIGHWKKRHVLKQLLFMEAASLCVFYLAWRLINWEMLYQTFGIEQVVPYAGLLLLAVLFEPLTFFLTPLASLVLRRFEREADAFSLQLLGEKASALASALKRLAKDNLANLHPHPLYAGFYYTHPPLVERIARIEGEASKKGP
ncbi:MAG: M48 family metallopeptidase [Deltaproteobacteria bacterium]|nr:M48 family metallopeptidase [Deltaproteobacteria bacterium]